MDLITTPAGARSTGIRTRIAGGAAVLLLLFSLATPGFAGPPAHAQGHNKSHGNSAAPYAPGQIKKRDHQHSEADWDRHIDRSGRDWRYVEDYARWNLAPPAPGHAYVRQDGRIFEVVKDTLAIVGAVALIDALSGN